MGKNKKSSGKRLTPRVKLRLDDLVEKLLIKCSMSWTSWNEEWEGFQEIFKIVEEIRLLEKDMQPKMSNRLDGLDAFLTWCTTNGAKSEGVTIEAVRDTELGVIATQPLKEDSPFFSVPRNLMISTETAKKSKLEPVIEKDPMLQKMPNILLAMHLLVELTEQESFWKPYIDILPESFSTILYFNLDDLQELKGSPTLAEAINICRSIARQYGYFYKLLQVNPDLKKLNLRNHFNYELYRWAVSCVMTRQNAIPSTKASEPTITSLVPLWDLCNHRNNKFSTDFNLEKDQLECFAMQDYQKGDEVCIFYGPRSNRELFLHSGFVVVPNPHDCYHLKIGISKSDPLYKEKEELCNKYQLPVSGTFKLMTPIGLETSQYLMNKDLLNFCQILTTNKVIKEADGLKMPDETRTFLKTRIMLLLRAYKTSVEEDEKLLLEKVNANVRLAVEVRLQEKRLLESILPFLEKI